MSVAVPTPLPFPTEAVVLRKSLLVMRLVVEISVVIEGQAVNAYVTLTAAKAPEVLSSVIVKIHFAMKKRRQIMGVKFENLD